VSAARLGWFPFDVDAYLGGTLTFTQAEHGAYLLALLAQFTSGDRQSIPGDLDRLEVLCRGPVSEHVLGKFDRLKDGSLRNARMAQTCFVAKRQHERAVLGGKLRAQQAKTQHSSSTATAELPVVLQLSSSTATAGQAAQQAAVLQLKDKEHSTKNNVQSTPDTGTETALSEPPVPTAQFTAEETEVERVRTAHVQAVFSHWCRVLDHGTAKLSPKRSRLIRARLKEGYTVEQLSAAIDGCRASPFHMGQNETGTRYDDLALICRDAEHVEQFVQLRQGDGRSMTRRDRAQLMAMQNFVEGHGEDRDSEETRTGELLGSADEPVRIEG
jgi:uncharacterized protein YdaU (DUF1376 family)